MSTFLKAAPFALAAVFAGSLSAFAADGQATGTITGLSDPSTFIQIEGQGVFHFADSGYVVSDDYSVGDQVTVTYELRDGIKFITSVGAM